MNGSEDDQISVPMPAVSVTISIVRKSKPINTPMAQLIANNFSNLGMLADTDYSVLGHPLWDR